MGLPRAPVGQRRGAAQRHGGGAGRLALIGEISAATIEQTGGIGQINEAVTQLDRATQQNAALVEQGTAAGGLRQQARRLTELMAAFRLDGRAPSASPAPRPVPAPKAVSTKAPAPKLALAATVASKPAATRAPAPERAPIPAPAPAVVAAGEDDWTSV